MPRGRPNEIGVETVAANGYCYVKTEEGTRLKHHIIAEETLGRPLGPMETVRFADGDRTNFKPENIVVTKKFGRSRLSRIAQIKSRIADLQAELEALEKEETDN